MLQWSHQISMARHSPLVGSTLVALAAHAAVNRHRLDSTRQSRPISAAASTGSSSDSVDENVCVCPKFVASRRSC